MLAHASYKDIGLDFWPVKGAPAHIATGVGLGLPGRLSTEFLQDQKDAFFQQMIQGPGILLGVYIYIEHLLKALNLSVLSPNAFFAFIGCSNAVPPWPTVQHH